MITVTREADTTVFAVDGEVTYDEQMAVLGPFYAAGPTRHVLWDFRRMTGSRVTGEELRRLVDFVRTNAARRPGGRTALVVGTDFDFGLARQTDLLSSSSDNPVQIRAFRSMDEARGWLAR